MCGLGCSGGGMKMGGKSSGSSRSMPKNWGGMKTSGSKYSGAKSQGTYGTNGGFGQPKVRMSFGSRNR